MCKEWKVKKWETAVHMQRMRQTIHRKRWEKIYCTRRMEFSRQTFA